MNEKAGADWKEFRLSDVFRITATPSGIDKNKLTGAEGTIPYITRTDSDNGYELFVEEQPHRYLLSEGNVITVGLDTQTVFYQETPFYTGQNIQILSNENMSKYSGLFVTSLLKRVLAKFNWGGNGATLSRLRRSYCLFPVDRQGNVFWVYMDAYMREIEKRQIQKQKEYMMIKHKQYTIKPVEECTWKEFELSELADITCGIYIHDAERIEGNIPYVSSTSLNNGIGYFVKNMNATYDSDCIAVNRNGSVGYAFYHSYKALYSYDCRKVKLRKKVSPYVSLFITSQIMQQKAKYEYGYKMGSVRLRKQKILLPVDGDGQIDYEYMAQYMKNAEQKILLKYNRILEEIVQKGKAAT